MAILDVTVAKLDVSVAIPYVTVDMLDVTAGSCRVLPKKFHSCAPLRPR